MHKLYDLKEKLMRELEGYADNGKYSKDDVEVIKYITSAIDHICNIMEDSDEYSAAPAGMYNGMYNGRSYARGRMTAPRDARGRYSGRMYSGAGDVMADLQDVMAEAPDDRTRQEIQNLITRLGRM